MGAQLFRLCAGRCRRRFATVSINDARYQNSSTLIDDELVCVLVTANAYNIADSRDPALDSDLGEGQLNRVKGRWMQLKVTVQFR